MAEDYAIPSSVRLEDLVNRSSNNAHYQRGVHYEFGPLSVIEGRQDGRNSQIILQYPQNRKPDFPVYYWRESPSRLQQIINFSGLDYLEPPALPFTAKDIVDLLRDEAGLVLEDFEYVNKTYTGFEESIELEITENSFGWLPGFATIQLVASSARITEDGDLRITEDGQVRLLEPSQL